MVEIGILDKIASNIQNEKTRKRNHKRKMCSAKDIEFVRRSTKKNIECKEKLNEKKIHACQLTLKNIHATA